ncbi:MAG: LysE family translocator [Kordiimonadaceae bacterium]|nr:LysE family translocator [Kordiimonadaceae bacterium]MBT6034907.1 LysE family translocator [Kordiimonadaceae bacterium]MBT6330931.1 LysE family translocator [Kordiimonadaceae bacterium]MBT7582989.1 LysE family translocator [Kordiimonadaceae bacterium]
MVSTEVLLAIFSTSFILALVPGPDNLFLLSQSALEGPLAGICLMLGLLTGILCHTAAVIFGVSVIITSSVLAFTILKIFGVCYLLYLAWGAFRAAGSKIPVSKNKPVGKLKLYRRGIFMNISNPKIAVFFLAFFPQFVDPSLGSVARQTVELAASFILAFLIVFIAIAYLAGTVGEFLRNSDKAQTILNRVAGTIFAGFALKLATSTSN